MTLGIFSVCFLHGEGSNPAAVRVFWKGRLPVVSVSSLMDSKGDVRHLSVCFLHGFESCCCSGVLEGASSKSWYLL